MIFLNAAEKEKDYWDGHLKICRYYAVNYPFYRMETHSHPEWEIMYVVHGRCRVTCRLTEEERDYDLREGEYILLGGMVRHMLTVEKEMPCRILNLEGRLEISETAYPLRILSGETALERFFSDKDRIMTGNDDGRLHETMNALIRELKEKEGAQEKTEAPMQNLLLGQLVVLLARQSVWNRRKQGGSGYVRRAREFLTENFDQEITVTSIASYVGISEGYLQRLYKKETGSSLMEDVLKLRVEKAKLLLESSTLPVIDVAVNAGFNTRQHFTAMFTQMTGCSPAAWRRNRGNLVTAHF